MNQTAFVLLAAATGVCIALQAAANGKFRQNLASPAAGPPDLTGPAWAAFLSICGTMTCALAAMALLRPAVPSKEAFQSAPWWNWIGGPLGALIVLAGATLTPRLGAAAFIASVVAGQLFCSLLLDHFGLMGLSISAINGWKVLGAVLVVGGVVCIKYL